MSDVLEMFFSFTAAFPILTTTVRATNTLPLPRHTSTSNPENNTFLTFAILVTL